LIVNRYTVTKVVGDSVRFRAPPAAPRWSDDDGSYTVAVRRGSDVLEQLWYINIPLCVVEDYKQQGLVDREPS
jgi:hypothetical protein